MEEEEELDALATFGTHAARGHAGFFFFFVAQQGMLMSNAILSQLQRTAGMTSYNPAATGGTIRRHGLPEEQRRTPPPHKRFRGELFFLRKTKGNASQPSSWNQKEKGTKTAGQENCTIKTVKLLVQKQSFFFK